VTSKIDKGEKVVFLSTKTGNMLLETEKSVSHSDIEESEDESNGKNRYQS
jgi:hypothetical protein